MLIQGMLKAGARQDLFDRRMIPWQSTLSIGGIIIPDTAKEKPQQGEVVAVGPGGRDEAGKLIPIDLQVGDRVLFGKWSGTEVKIDGVEYLIMKESDVMGVLTNTAARRSTTILPTARRKPEETCKSHPRAPAAAGAQDAVRSLSSDLLT
jgi:chaperonin GroES